MFSFFFLNDTATTEIYTLSLHDALPISDTQRRSDQEHSHRADHVVPEEGHRWRAEVHGGHGRHARDETDERAKASRPRNHRRSEEHTSELQSQSNLVCRLLLEKKKHQEY